MMVKSLENLVPRNHYLFLFRMLVEDRKDKWKKFQAYVGKHQEGVQGDSLEELRAFISTWYEEQVPIDARNKAALDALSKRIREEKSTLRKEWWKRAEEEKISQLKFCKQYGVPRSTFNDWLNYKIGISKQCDDAVISFIKDTEKIDSKKHTSVSNTCCSLL